MSTQSLLGYDDIPSLHRAPSYTAEPLENEQRIALNDRLRPRPTGSFVKHSKHGHARLKLLAQEDDIAMPVYGLSGSVQGTVELDTEKAETVDSVEVKLEGALKLDEIAEAGATTVKLVIDTQLLWEKGPNGGECPNNLDFSLTLPTTFTYQGFTYPLPPSYSVKLKGLPGFTASIDYSVSALINRPQTVPSMVPLVKSKTLGIHIGTTVVSTPFLYHPRTRPPAPLPRPLTGTAPHSFELSPEWKTFEVVSAARKSRLQDVVVKLHIPKSRIFSLTEKIPFAITMESSAVSLAAFLPFGPRVGPANSNVAMVLDVLRQSTVDVRNELVTDAKQDMWRVDRIGGGTFNQVLNTTDKSTFSGEISISETIRVGGFRTAGFGVKDCIVLTMIPPVPGKCPFRDFRLTIPIRFATDPWAADGTGLGLSTDLHAPRDQESNYSVPSSPDD